MPESTIGFVYEIVNVTKNRRYIGKKTIFSTLTKPLNKKELKALEDKRSSKKKKVTKESTWRNYTGSNPDLNADIKAGDTITKTILEYAFTKLHLTFLETEYLFTKKVLYTDEYYNHNILGKFYKNAIPTI